MSSIKITTFLGTAPKIASELLPNTAAQIARNCKLNSGDLVPFVRPVVVNGFITPFFPPPTTIKTIYPFRDDNGNFSGWRGWTTVVNIATPSSSLDNTEQRIYFTGSGVPKVSNKFLYGDIRSFMYDYGVPRYQNQTIGDVVLGLPLPTQKPFTSVASFAARDVVSFARDSGNVVTLTFGQTVLFGLKTGAVVTISGYSTRSATYSRTDTTITVTLAGHGFTSGDIHTLTFTSGTATSNSYRITVVNSSTFTVTDTASGSTSGNVSIDISNLNATNVECTVLSDTTLTYFKPGPQYAQTFLNNVAKVSLAGLTQSRSYVYTWLTPWGEESIASEPTSLIYLKEGQTVTVTNLPTEPPASPAPNFIAGINLYRTVTSTAAGTEYFKLQTLWFPNRIYSGSVNANGIATIRTVYPHNLGIDDGFKISGTPGGVFDTATLNVDLMNQKVTEIVDEYEFKFNLGKSFNVFQIVTSGKLYYDVQENYVPGTFSWRFWGDAGGFGFVDDFNVKLLTTILASDNYEQPPEDLEGLTAIQNNILAGFVGNTLYFSEPGLFHAWPSEYSKVLEHNIVGLAVISGFLIALTDGYPYAISGSDPSNFNVVKIDALYPCLSRQSIVSMNYGIVYATHDGLALISPTLGSQIVTKLLYSSDTWNTNIDPFTLVATAYEDNYFAAHSTGAITFERDEKVGGYFIDHDYTFSAAYYDSKSNRLLYCIPQQNNIYEWDVKTQPNVSLQWKSKTIITKDYINIGAARVVADYSETTTIWEETEPVWSNASQKCNSAQDITFNFYVNKQLIFTRLVTDSEIFRLPTGYKSDTFEVEVLGDVRVRAIHLGQSPKSLATT